MWQAVTALVGSVVSVASGLVLIYRRPARDRYHPDTPRKMSDYPLLYPVPRRGDARPQAPDVDRPSKQA